MCVCPSSHQANSAPAKNLSELSATAISYYSSELWEERAWEGEEQFLPFLYLMAFSAGVIEAVVKEIKRQFIIYQSQLNSSLIEPFGNVFNVLLKKLVETPK